MTFNSLVYAAFLPLVVGLFWLLPHRFRIWLILAASYTFYGAWDWRFLALLWISTLADWWVGRRLDRTDDERRRKQLLAVSVLVNLGLLGFFKYFGFFVESAIAMGNRAGLDLDPFTMRILLPVGISFYTFQTLSYSIDVYRRRIPACQSLPLFAGYVAFFPQLVAGPIERAERLLPQLETERTPPRAQEIESALALILVGLVKKVVIADQLAPLVQHVYSDPGAFDRGAIAAASLAFAIQIYGDFSGYTDIARGSARLLGIELMENFREPFLARDITELWRRWHISLTSWLRDYVYVPLGGSRGSMRRANLAVVITWLVTGLWHGAGLTFIAFGLLNGAFLVGHRALRQRRPPTQRTGIPGGVQAVLGAAVATSMFAFSALFFRSESFADSLDAIGNLWTDQGAHAPTWTLGTLLFGLVAILSLDAVRARSRRSPVPAAPPALLRGLAVGTAVVAVIISSGGPAPDFIYFQF